MFNFWQYFNFWIFFGFLAQFIFFMRVLVQWISSEKAKKSVIPVTYWYLSIIGAIMLLIYSFHIKDPVFIVSGILSTVIYFRNLYLVKINEKEDINSIK